MGYEVDKLEIGKQQIKDEMKKIGRMKESVAFVHVLLESMNTGLRYSQRKRESNVAPTWTWEEFEEAVEEVFIGIEDSLKVLISDHILLEQLGLRVTVSAKKMKEVIKTCEVKFGGSF